MTERLPLTRVLTCAAVGVTGGACALAMNLATFRTGVVLGGAYGALFALLAPGASSAGAGLLRGLAYLLTMWLIFPNFLFPLLTGTHQLCTCDIARAHFPELVGYLLFLGAPLGLSLGL